ncbi:MAG: hypothetical protein J6X89_02895 [Bacteroidales bacterium]|nr:hypothetical protein [Bacteroidales bacterium]
MERNIVLEPVSLKECCLVTGGVDKSAQNALYYIGYAIGFVVKCILGLLALRKPQVSMVE